MTLRIPAKVLIHVWSYDFYDMTLSTGKQRRHMIKTHSYTLDFARGTNINNTFIKLMTASDMKIIKAVATFIHDCEIT